MKDWSGNKKTTFVTLGASNHCEEERAENDYYATDPIALEMLLEYEKFNKNVWECACGGGHLVNVLVEHGYNVTATDLVYRGAGNGGIDFLSCEDIFDGDVITNPPYIFADRFVEKAHELIPDGNRVAMFLKLTFLEGKKRRLMFEKYPPKAIYVFSQRIRCAKNGDFDSIGSSAVCYAWFIWEKGSKTPPIIKWI